MKQNVFHGAFLIALILATSSASHAQAARNQDMMRDAINLAATLGRVHAVRVACNGNGDQYWRDKMKDLLTLEAPDQGAFRRSMAGAFNDAFQTESRRHPVCDQDTVAAEAAHAAEGRRLADALATANFPR